jgi:hypothetical protein
MQARVCAFPRGGHLCQIYEHCFIQEHNVFAKLGVHFHGALLPAMRATQHDKYQEVWEDLHYTVRRGDGKKREKYKEETI